MDSTIYYTIAGDYAPAGFNKLFYNISSYFAKKDMVLRTSGSKGIGSDAIKGCDDNQGQYDAFVPWDGYNKIPICYELTKEAFDIAEAFNGKYSTMSQTNRKILAAMSYQVLGDDLISPSDFVICYSNRGKGKGGNVGHLIKIAKAYGVPIFDIGKYQNRNDALVNLYFFLKNELGYNI